MYRASSTGPYVGAQTDGLLTTTASYPSSVVSSVTADRRGENEIENYRCEPLREYDAAAAAAAGVNYSAATPRVSPHSPHGSIKQGYNQYPSPRAKLSPSIRDESEERTINYEELKMKISYKKFERECIMGKYYKVGFDL